MLNWKNYKLYEGKNINGGQVVFQNKFWKIIRFDEQVSMKNAAQTFNVLWAAQEIFENTEKWEEYRKKITPYIVWDLSCLKSIFSKNENNYRNNLEIIRVDLIEPKRAHIIDINGNNIKYWPMLKQFGRYFKPHFINNINR